MEEEKEDESESEKKEYLTEGERQKPKRRKK